MNMSMKLANASASITDFAPQTEGAAAVANQTTDVSVTDGMSATDAVVDRDAVDAMIDAIEEDGQDAIDEGDEDPDDNPGVLDDEPIC
jgi:hypothetical protein